MPVEDHTLRVTNFVTSRAVETLIQPLLLVEPDSNINSPPGRNLPTTTPIPRVMNHVPSHVAQPSTTPQRVSEPAFNAHVSPGSENVTSADGWFRYFAWKDLVVQGLTQLAWTFPCVEIVFQERDKRSQAHCGRGDGLTC